jgi:hypothetical protein
MHSDVNMLNLLKKILFPPPLSPEYHALSPRIASFFEAYLLPFWWVIFILMLCTLFYESSLEKINLEYANRHHQYLELQNEQHKALAIQEDFLLQINSQSDQDWVELTLMKVLGLVPDEQVKVFFTNQD